MLLRYKLHIFDKSLWGKPLTSVLLWLLSVTVPPRSYQRGFWVVLSPALRLLCHSWRVDWVPDYLIKWQLCGRRTFSWTTHQISAFQSWFLCNILIYVTMYWYFNYVKARTVYLPSFTLSIFFIIHMCILFSPACLCVQTVHVKVSN